VEATMNVMVKTVAALVVLGHGAVAVGGFVPFVPSHERSEIPPSVRHSPGGYRSWSFWHSGSHGGK
jgi:hypothetical protein